MIRYLIYLLDFVNIHSCSVYDTKLTSYKFVGEMKSNVCCINFISFFLHKISIVESKS